MRKIVIIGNGISGISAARHIRKLSDHSITIISAETEHFFSRTALMYIYMGHMKFEHTKPYEDWFWKKNRLELVQDYVTSINTNERSISLKQNKSIHYDTLIIATGSKPNKFGWPGQDLPGVQGLYSYPDLQNMERFTKDIDRAVIVGGGLIGIEMAEMLLSRNIQVTFLVREKSFWNVVLPKEESDMINRHISEHQVELKLETELKEIVADVDGKVGSVITSAGEMIECQFVGLTVGVTPNIDFIRSSDVETDRGVLVNEYFETNIPDIYAIGDCAQFKKALPGRKPIEQVWYTGRMHGETVAMTICSEKTAYLPGPWFNSAKFFDIEYQVYGDIKNEPAEDEDYLHWEHPNGKHSIRIVFDKETTKVLGFNLMGIRYRHEVCEQWLINGAFLRDVVSNLKKANFDPEFYRQYEEGILSEYNNRYQNQQIRSSAKRSLLKLIS